MKDPKAGKAGGENGAGQNGKEPKDTGKKGGEADAPAEESEAESGDEDGEEAADTAAKSSIDPAMRMEVDLITLGVARRVAAAVAARCKAALTANQRQRVLLVPTSAASAVMAAQTIVVELEALADELELLAKPPAGGPEAVFPPLPKLSAAAITGAAETVGKVVKTLADAAGKLAVKDSYSSRSVGIDESTLMAVIGGRLLDAGVQAVMIGGDSPFVARRPEVLTRLASAMARLASADLDEAASTAAEALLKEVRAAMARLGDSTAPYSLGFRLLAAMEGETGVPVLTARSLAAGGSYRERTHLLTRLGFRDPLSFSGGAALLFTLSSAGTGELLAADILYDASGRSKTKGKPRIVRLSNLDCDELD